jgi:hypothetical protein
VERREWLLRLCRRTALHGASLNGRTKTAMALVKAGADVHCKANDGCGFSGFILVPVGLPRCGADGSVHLKWSCRSGCCGRAGGLHCTMRRSSGTMRRRWRWSSWAPTCTTRATSGTFFWAALFGRWVATVAGADGPSSRGGAAGVAVSAVQVDGAALGVIQWPHGNRDGAGEGGRGRALQGRRRVRFLGLHPGVVGLPQWRGRTVRPLGAELQEWLFGLAGGRRCIGRRRTATRRRRWRW